MFELHCSFCIARNFSRVPWRAGVLAAAVLMSTSACCAQEAAAVGAASGASVWTPPSVGLASPGDAAESTTFRVKVGGKSYVILARAGAIESVTVDGVSAPALARIQGKNLECLDEAGRVLARLSLPREETMVTSGAGDVTTFATPGSRGRPAGTEGGSAFGWSRAARTPTAHAASLTPLAPMSNSLFPSNSFDPADFVGRTVMIGIQMVAIEPALEGHFGLESGHGAMVYGVAAGLPAAEAGIKPFDLIITVEGDPVTSLNALQGAIRARHAKPGDTLSLRVISAGIGRDVTLTLAPFEEKRFMQAMWNRMPYDPAAQAAGSGMNAPSVASFGGQSAQELLRGSQEILRNTRAPVITTMRTPGAAAGARGSGATTHEVMIMPDRSPPPEIESERMSALEARVNALSERIELLLTKLEALPLTSGASGGPPGPAEPTRKTAPTSGGMTPSPGAPGTPRR
ncbi:hypothetical protein BH11PLA1_BH11PLA1_23300 [soil metagenome]